MERAFFQITAGDFRPLVSVKIAAVFDFAVLMAAVATLLLLPWALRRLPNFTPKTGDRELTYEKAKSIIEQSHADNQTDVPTP